MITQQNDGILINPVKYWSTGSIHFRRVEVKSVGSPVYFETQYLVNDVWVAVTDADTNATILARICTRRNGKVVCNVNRNRAKWSRKLKSRAEAAGYVLQNISAKAARNLCQPRAKGGKKESNLT